MVKEKFEFVGPEESNKAGSAAEKSKKNRQGEKTAKSG